MSLQMEIIMQPEEFILELLHVFLSWPFLTFVILLLFRKEVTKIFIRLAERLKRAEIGGQAFDFIPSMEDEAKISETLQNISAKNPVLLHESLSEAEADDSIYHDYVAGVRNRVRHVQRFLQEQGYFIDTIDGIVGTNTREAIKKFQRDNQLFVDGIIGPQTLRKIAELKE